MEQTEDTNPFCKRFIQIKKKEIHDPIAVRYHNVLKISLKLGVLKCSQTLTSESR
jgi:hypothetical protein